MRILHVSGFHQPLDIRIYHRECRTLAAAGHDVTLLCTAPPCEHSDGVELRALPVRPNRSNGIRRLIEISCAVNKTVRRHNVQVVHFHEVFLLPMMCVLAAEFRLRRRGIRFIYDVHEDWPQSAYNVCRNKKRPWLAFPLASAYEAWEWISRCVVDRFVCATPAIARRFPPGRTVVVHNYPLKSELSSPRAGTPVSTIDRPFEAIFAGGLSETRGAREMIDAMELVNAHAPVRLRLMGRIVPDSLAQELAARPGWRHVDATGPQPRESVLEAYRRARCGLVLFHPGPNHTEALPNKLFE